MKPELTSFSLTSNTIQTLSQDAEIYFIVC